MAISFATARKAPLLDVKQKRVLISRWQVPDTVEDLAMRLGLSRERLRLIERRALSRLKYGLLTRGVSAAQLG